MYFHLIALSKINEKEIAYHYSSTDYGGIKHNRHQFGAIINPKTAAFSFHLVKTDSATFESVQQMDPYFAKVYATGSVEEFALLLKDNTLIQAVDVAAYIQQKYDMKPFTLQKTLYYMYADYLETTNKHLFQANFVAFKQGPVDMAVYRENRYQKKDLLVQRGLNIKAAILKDGVDRLNYIEEKIAQYAAVLDKFWDDSADNPTHRTGTPWSIAYAKHPNAVICDEDVIKYHQLERL